MTQIIDRRKNGKNKSAVNRQRFINRFKNQIKEAVANAISKRSITDIQSGEKIIIPKKDISEPVFQHDQGGFRNRLFPGNKEFMPGDHIKRPSSNSGGGDSKASNQGEGTDDFGFEISKEEFIDLFFEDLELPDLVKQKLAKVPAYDSVNAGYTTYGVPANISIIRSLRNSIGRRIAFRSVYNKKLKKLEAELAALDSEDETNETLITELEQHIHALKIRRNSVPFIDTYDLRFRNKVKVPKPNTNAVMFCLMDVSGSMDETKKEIAKRFFILLYLFLTKTYEKIDIVFIRHHTTAKEVDEHEFFYSRETGGTVVSSALDEMKDIIHKRYPAGEWNIYAAQASDGDNWNADSPRCQELLTKDILPSLQYFAYVEILPRHHQSLWRAYLAVKEFHKNFAMRNINSIKDIYPVFHELFKRKEA